MPVNNKNVFSVNSEIQEWVLIALLLGNEIFWTAVKNDNH